MNTHPAATVYSTHVTPPSLGVGNLPVGGTDAILAAPPGDAVSAKDAVELWATSSVMLHSLHNDRARFLDRSVAKIKNIAIRSHRTHEHHCHRSDGRARSPSPPQPTKTSKVSVPFPLHAHSRVTTFTQLRELIGIKLMQTHMYTLGRSSSDPHASMCVPVRMCSSIMQSPPL